MRLLISVAFVIVVFAATGCYTPRYVYSPSAHNVPLLTEKADAKLAVNFSTNVAGRKIVNDIEKQSKASGMDIQAAYAYKKKWALQANFFSRREVNEGDFSINRDSALIRYKRSMGEAGIGYFKKMDDRGNLVFQVFTGIGFGKFSFIDNGKDANRMDYSRFHNSTVTKFYLQPAWIFMNNQKRIAASLSSRFSFINYSNIHTDYTSEELDKYQLYELSRGPILFWEPAFINSFGFSKLPGLYLEYQVGMSLLMSRRFIDNRFLNLSIGIYVEPPVLFKKKKTKATATVPE